MASINGIVLRVRKCDDLSYKGELCIKENGKLEKIAFWKQMQNGYDVLRPEEGYSRAKIINAIKSCGLGSFEDCMYELAILAEYERWYRIARKNGYSGLGIVECDEGYVGKYLDKKERSETPECVLEQEKDELFAKYKDTDIRYKMFLYPLDFVMGEPVAKEELEC